MRPPREMDDALHTTQGFSDMFRRGCFAYFDRICQAILHPHSATNFMAELA